LIEKKSFIWQYFLSNIANLLIKLSVLSISNEVEELAKEIIKKGAINESYSEDAYHIAVAIINKMDFLLSWTYC